MKMNMVRYKVSDVDNQPYYETPAFIFEGKFKKLSSDAKILYTILSNDSKTSKEQMANLLNCTQSQLAKAINELSTYGLISEDFKPKAPRNAR